jgi:hypothetical protein
MNTVLIVCAVAVTIGFIIFVFHAVETLIQVRHTAKAVEYLALNADNKLAALDPMINAAKSVSENVSSGWFRAVQFFYNLVKNR